MVTTEVIVLQVLNQWPLSFSSVLFHPEVCYSFCFKHCWYFHNIPYFTMKDLYSVNLSMGLCYQTRLIDNHYYTLSIKSACKQLWIPVLSSLNPSTCDTHWKILLIHCIPLWIHWHRHIWWWLYPVECVTTIENPHTIKLKPMVLWRLSSLSG